MRALLQRVSRASVTVDGAVIGSIGPGLLVLLGVGRTDDGGTASMLARRVVEMRIFEDEDGRTNRSLLDVEGQILVVSQFTLYADLSRGRRPGFVDAALPDHANRVYRVFVEALEGAGLRVATGRFAAKMAVELVNDGPFTIWLDTEAR